MLWNNNGWAYNDNRDDPCRDYPRFLFRNDGIYLRIRRLTPDGRTDRSAAGAAGRAAAV